MLAAVSVVVQFYTAIAINASQSGSLVDTEDVIAPEPALNKLRANSSVCLAAL
jgi:hypothetical protein